MTALVLMRDIFGSVKENEELKKHLVNGAKKSVYKMQAWILIKNNDFSLVYKASPIIITFTMDLIQVNVMLDNG
jgi:hypothetical protein